MATLQLDEPMTKKTGTGSVKIDADLLWKAKRYAMLTDITLQEYLDSLIRAGIERDYAKAMKKLLKEAGEAPAD